MQLNMLDVSLAFIYLMLGGVIHILDATDPRNMIILIALE